jgi:DNA-binding transcriptional ArsR family regulator
MQLARLRATLPFQALADETRIRAWRLLLASQAPVSPGQLAQALQVAPATLSRHLEALEVAGLTVRHRRGRSHFIAPNCNSPMLGLLAKVVLCAEDDNLQFSGDLERLLVGAFERRDCEDQSGESAFGTLAAAGSMR